MKNLPFETYRLEFTPLSPIHIGSGESIEPYEYVLQQQEEDTFLLALDIPRLVSELDSQGRQRLDTILDRADYLSLRKWISNIQNPKKYMRYAILVMRTAANEIEKNIGDPNRLGRIELMCRRPSDGLPYIPGSSIKGAIRTAMVDSLLEPWRPKKESRTLNPRVRVIMEDKSKNGPKSTKLEAIALGNADGKSGNADHYQDPFRQLAFSDIQLPIDGCYIDKVQIVRPVKSSNRRQHGSEGKIQIYRDLTWSLLDGDPVTYEGEFRHYTRLKNNVSRVFTVQEIIKACNEYYLEEVERQLDEFTPRTQNNDKDIREPLLDAVSNLQEHECIIRLGRHSHFECVVFSRPFNKPPEKGYGSTRTYVNGSLPLGWAKLGFTPLHA